MADSTISQSSYTEPLIPELTIPASLKFFMNYVKAMITTPLTAYNYHLWSSQIYKLFKSVSLEGFLSGASTCPPQYLPENSLSPNPQYTQWHLIDQNLSAALYSTISSPILPYILNLNTTIEIWQTLLTRLVAQGFNQEHGVDYHETFSPVAKITTIRVLLAVAAHHQWEVLQFDVSNAFLYGRLDDIIYMAQPPGFIDRRQPDHVCRLYKSLYGLKQAPRMWYSTLSSYLHQQGFSLSTADPSLLTYQKSDTYIYFLIYVDDILITDNHPHHIQTLVSNLQTRFAMKALGPISTFLGIQFTKTPYGYFLNQSSYIHTILKTAHLQDSKPVPTPIPVKSPSTPESATSFDQPSHYRHLAGSLQYLTITRPDIAFAVNHLCQHMHNPTLADFQLLKRVLRYLKGTAHLGMPIRAAPLCLSSYSDSDWATDTLTRRSTTGYCTFLGSTLISWKVQKQKTVARSSTEAELRALAAAVTDTIWLRRLLSEFGAPPSSPTPLYCDNTSTLALASNPILHARTKHVEINFHFLRDHVSSQHISLHHIPTQEQVADTLTKPQPTSRFLWLRDKLTVQQIDHEFAGG